MSEFIDNVAKAIFEVQDHDGDIESWINAPERWKVLERVKARAAISAMEPTPEMIEAGQEVYPGLSRGALIIVWNAMRAAALADEKETG